MQNLATSKTKLETSILNKLNQTEQKLVVLQNSGNVRFAEMNNEQKQGLAKSLVKLSYFVGIKEPLSIENLKMLVFYLHSQHPTFTLEELEQSFLMASSGEFGELEHYQTFSPMYVSKIINTYGSRRAIAVSKYRELENTFQAQKEITEKQRNYNAVEGCITAICTQYDKFLKYDIISQDIDKLGLEEFSAKIAIELAQRLGLFADFNPKEESAFDFFKRIFQPIANYEPDKSKKIIGMWVKSKVAEVQKN